MVDDFAPWRRFIIAKLRENHNLRIVGVVSDGLDAIQKAGELQPDLILLDIALPTISGIVAARRIRHVAPKSKILLLSQTADLDLARIALREGGHGYVVKSDADNELFAAVEAVMQGKKFVSSRLADASFTDDVDSQAGGQLCREETVASPAAPPSHRKGLDCCHEVQFYPDDSLFLDGFTHFVGTALKAGNAAVFIGTDSHRTTLLERLHAESPDIRTAIRHGRYVALNAVEFLSTSMVNDMPDVDWFLKVVDDLVVAARKGADGEHLRVAVCGECASMLWQQGKADAAIRLEELWNQIAQTYDVDVLCGYSLESLRCDEDGYNFHRVYEKHSAVHSC